MNDFWMRVKGQSFLQLWGNLQLDRNSALALLLFLINAFLISAVFFPTLSEINAWDEAAYVHSGQALTDDGVWPMLADNPATALFFGLTYLPFRSSPLWMIYSITVARMLLFSLLWLGTFLVARELTKWASPLLALGLLFVTPLAVEMLQFPSDPLFAGFASLSLWQLLKHLHHSDRRHLASASIFMALASLARNDGLVLFIILVCLTLILEFRRKTRTMSLAATILPFLGIVGGYVLFSGMITGSFQTGVPKRTYQNFESGQQLIYAEIGGINPVIEARVEARRLFGTPEENQNSVFRAIIRNPSAYLDRLLAVVKLLPETLLHAYGIRFSTVIFLFVIRGLVELLHAKKYRLALILVLWPLHLMTGFIITLFRVGHFQFPFYVVFALAAIGIYATISNLDHPLERRWISAALLLLALYGVVDEKLAVYYSAALALIALWVVILIRRKTPLTNASAGFILLAAGIILRQGFPSPAFRTSGVDSKEQMVTFLVENYEKDTYVAAGSPGVVWAAKMRPAVLTSTDVPTRRSSEEFLDWMTDQGIDIIYVDLDLYGFSPQIWNMIEAQIGLGLTRVFSLESGNYQVLELTGED